VTASAHQVDQLLGTDPEEHGESRPYGRIAFIGALVVVYRVETGRPAVTVAHVRLNTARQ
jgi:hypothetical protein